MSGVHVGIIMDGNGRWARQRGRPRWRGHLAGVESVRDTVRAAPELGITTLSLYAFSADNWKRPAAEVGRLFWLLREYCQRERAELLDNGVRVSAIGRRDRIPHSALAQLARLEEATEGGTRLHLRLAIDYSAQWSIVAVARQLADDVHAGRRSLDEISVTTMEERLSEGTPPVDLLVRTAGEQRLSDFLLWETAYAELYFTPALWPDFRRDDLRAAMDEFRRRERRFGGLQAIDALRPPARPEPAPPATLRA